MQINAVNGWREIIARVFDGFDVELGLSPQWLVNPDTGRRLKLDYSFPDIGLAVRFVGLEGTTRRGRKSDEEVAAEERREQARAEVCRTRGVVLVSIDPDGEPRAALRSLEMGLARVSAQLAKSGVPHARKQALMPKISDARRRAGEFTTRLTSQEKLNLYAEMWRDREAALATPLQLGKPVGPARSYRAGMDVEHERFGLGQITAVEPEGADQKITVDFVEAGVRSFYASLLGDSKLHVLDAS